MRAITWIEFLDSDGVMVGADLSNRGILYHNANSATSPPWYDFMHKFQHSGSSRAHRKIRFPRWERSFF
ncbi:MAG: hypothetical protein WC830_05505 [Burkholderiales bacterium]